jgi:hypothetical protein
MYMYNWYHSDIKGIHCVHGLRYSILQSDPLAFCSPFLSFPFAPCLSPFTYLEPSLL